MVLATQGNLNNDIGVPLTLLQLTPEHKAAVIEMGANHPGEIAYLTELARPDAAVITNAGPAHLEGFGSVAGVARAKGEIYGGLRENGVAVINADDDYAELWRELAGTHRRLCFGLSREADISASWQTHADGTQLQLQTPAGGTEFVLPLSGRHNVLNALAATALALSLGCELAEVSKGLSGMSVVGGRLQRRSGMHGAQLIDDSYNANPASMQAAIDVLAMCKGKRILVVGDMGELGAEAEQLHEQIGSAARKAGIDALYATGPLSRAAAMGFGPAAHYFDDQSALVDALSKELSPDVTVLIKGSRSARMERVVERLLAGGNG